MLLEKGYDAISIQDIATGAEAARVTFYRHYKNKEELLLDCLNVVYEELVERVKQVSSEKIQQEYIPLMAFYEHIQEKEELYQILFSSQGAHFLVKRLNQLIAQRTRIQIVENIPKDQLLVPIEIIANHIGSAIIGLVVWWLENDKPYPPEYMAQLSYWLSFAGNARALGFDQYQFPPPQMPD